ncbi:stage III sporulation protein AF [Geomicrobium sediminis]|uniref:Stage III sporulation protein AF n=1 Tax=Geomicrobium sediminis TaxID=1347788 RepID=A0ABS2PE25_9BACL|nr:stage III sporulation protein AF [Geomicrobium sediminis]EZH67722.1 hypothetical protein DH09_07285 [Bacillaceae bacterium JMAK1]MBM7633653.1 stage III sporulation protein AF [Geomicrobium sediminis]
MEYFHDWVTTLIVFLLLAIILELLLPTSTMKRYADLVLGLMMIVLLLQPVFDLVHTDPSEWFDLNGFSFYEGATEMENKINQEKIEIQAAHDAYISEQVAARLSSEAQAELEGEFDLSFRAISVHEGGINVLVSDADDQRNTSVAAIEPVKEVTVNAHETVEETVDEDSILSEVRARLAEIWEVDEQMIQVSLEEEGLNG